MSKPEPIEEPSLEESLAMVRRMLAEGAPAPRPPAANGAAPASHGTVGRGRLSDALKSVATYPPEQEKRLGLGGVDDDLADLMDTGPAAAQAAPAHVAPVVVKDLAPMDLRGRARVAPSFDGDPRAGRGRAEIQNEPTARLPGLEAADGPAAPALPSPQAMAARDPLEAMKLPMGRSPASRLPPLGGAGPVEPAPAPATDAAPGGWPRGAARAEPELPGPVSAPPSAPVVIAAMPAPPFGAGAPPPAPMAVPGGFMESAERRTPVLPMPAVEAAAAQEMHEDSRFELIAAIGPAVAAVRAAPPMAETAPAPELAFAPALEESGEGAPAAIEKTSGALAEEAAVAELETPAIEMAAGAVEAEAGTASVADVIASIEVIASTAFSADAAAADEPTEAVAELPAVAPDVPPAMVAAAVDEVASVLDRLVAGLSLSAGSGAELPGITPEMQAAAETAAAAAVAAVSMPSDVAPLAPGVEAPGIEAVAAEAAAPHADTLASGADGLAADMKAGQPDGADAMLKLVGTSVALGEHGGLEAPGEAFDDTVAELLRPMLRKWLESNMPRIVEKALRKELAELQADIRKAGEDGK